MKILLVALVIFLISNAAAQCSAILTKSTIDSPLAAEPTWLGPDFKIVLAVTKSFGLYRSANYGRDWSRAALPQGSTVGSIEMAPSDNNYIMFVGGDKKSLLKSTNAASSISLVTLPVSNKTISFLKIHPTIPSWVLVITDEDDMLYLSRDFGSTWNQIRTNVFRVELLVETYDDDKPGNTTPDFNNTILVMENTSGGPRWGNNALTRSRNFFADNTATKVIVQGVRGYSVKGNAIFAAKSDPQGGLQLYASEDYGDTFRTIDFPVSNVTEQRYSVLDISEGFVFINVLPRGASNWGNLYVSNSLTSDFSLSLSNNPRGRQGRCDFSSVSGLEGIYLANQYAKPSAIVPDLVNKHTMISFDKGGKWSRLSEPVGIRTLKDKNNVNFCDLNRDGTCNLNLGDPTETTVWRTNAHALGIIFGTGNVGPQISDAHPSYGLYMSRTGGSTWEFLVSGNRNFGISHQGDVFILTEQGVATNSISYSLDQGLHWNSCNFSNIPDLYVDDVSSDPSLKSQSALVYGSVAGDKGVIIHADLSSVYTNDCQGHDNPDSGTSDYELWKVQQQEGECVLGRTTLYVRRKRSANCRVTLLDKFVHNITNCVCTEDDYECDYCYNPNDNDPTICEPDPACTFTVPTCAPGQQYYQKSSGYRKIPGDSCVNGKTHPPVNAPCSTTSPTPAPTTTSTPSSTPTPAPVHSPAPTQPPAPTGTQTPTESPQTPAPEPSNPLLYFQNLSTTKLLMIGGALALLLLLVLLGSLWYATKCNMGLRRSCLRCVPEKYLPDIGGNARYAQLWEREVYPYSEENRPMFGGNTNFEDDDL